MARQARYAWAAGAALLIAVLVQGAQEGGSPTQPQAILFEPGSVNAFISDQSVWLANSSLVATWDLSRGGIRLASIYDRLGGRPAPRTGEAFALTLADGRTIRGSELRRVGAPRSSPLTAAGQAEDARQGRAAPAAPAPAGKSVAADFETLDGTLRATWLAFLGEGADYVRQAVTLTPTRAAIAITSVVLVDVETRDPKIVGTGKGAPATGGGAFFAVEHPAGRCAAEEGRIRCGLAPTAGSTVREPFRAAWVIGLAPPTDLDQGLRRYAEREGDAVPPAIRAAPDALPATAAPAAVPARPATIAAGPYLQNPGQTEMTVMWVTDRPSAGWVEYAIAPAVEGAAASMPPSAIKAVAVRDGLVEAGGTIHRVRLTGLQPDTPYLYRVVSRAIGSYGAYKVDYGDPMASAPARLRTLAAAPRPFSFVVLNDLHEDVDVMAAHMERAMTAPPDLVFFNGDSLSHLESDQQILDRLLAPAGRLFANRVPLLLVRGNHETRGRNARRLGDHLALPDGRYYYAFTHGSVRFLVLDCGEDKEDEHWAYSGLTAFDEYRAVQAAWLEAEVRGRRFRDARFRVLVAHMPFFGNEGTNVRGHGPSDCRERWGALLNEAGLDLHIAGHTHRTNWVPPAPGANRFPVVVGGSPTRGNSTMIRVDVGAGRLAITLTRDDGIIVATREVPARTAPLAAGR